MYLWRKIARLEYTERVIESQDWATLLLLGCFVILAVAKYSYSKRFDEFIVLPASDKYLKVRGYDDAVSHPFGILLFAVQAISVSIFIYLFFKVFNPIEVQTNKWLFVQIFTGYTIFVFIKFSIEKILANIFSIDSLIDQYLYQKLNHRNFLGILIFVGNLFFLYIFTPTQASLIIFSSVILLFNALALFYTYKKNRNLVTSNFFHFILYLCALEISPYIILYNLFFYRA